MSNFQLFGLGRYYGNADSGHRLWKDYYPWAREPVLIGAPMRMISTPELVTEMALAGGIGFLGVGEMPELVGDMVSETRTRILNPGRYYAHFAAPLGFNKIHPYGVGLLLNGPSASPPCPFEWNPESNIDAHSIPLLHALLEQIAVPENIPPAAVWLFGWQSLPQLAFWMSEIRNATHNRTHVWLQFGSVKQAWATHSYLAHHADYLGNWIEPKPGHWAPYWRYGPDVIVAQGSDAGGHGLRYSASLMTLLPEMIQTFHPCSPFSNKAVVQLGQSRFYQGRASPVIVGAGGLTSAPSIKASFVLGAAGAVLGTLLLGCPEADISDGYRSAVFDTMDGGRATRRTRLYDCMRGSPAWGKGFTGRGKVNELYWRVKGIGDGSEANIEDANVNDTGWLSETDFPELDEERKRPLAKPAAPHPDIYHRAFTAIDATNPTLANTPGQKDPGSRSEPQSLAQSSFPPHLIGSLTQARAEYKLAVQAEKKGKRTFHVPAPSAGRSDAGARMESSSGDVPTSSEPQFETRSTDDVLVRYMGTGVGMVNWSEDVLELVTRLRTEVKQGLELYFEV